MTEQTKYYVKQVDRKFGAPNWVVYERTEAGSRAVCLCYEEGWARRIAELLTEAASRVIRL